MEGVVVVPMGRVVRPARPSALPRRAEYHTSAPAVEGGIQRGLRTAQGG